MPVHAALLFDGRLLTWSRLESPHVWDPAANTFQDVPLPSWIFCSGQSILPNGQVLVTGGHITDDHGLPDVNIFDPATSSWIPSPPMARGRWYPTSITLADGSVVVLAGTTQEASQNTVPEVRNADGSWRELTGASLTLPYYPWVFAAPNGRPFVAGPGPLSRYLDTTGAGRWITGPSSNYGPRNYGSAVMYEPGKILVTGGDVTPPTNTAEILDLNSSSPAWRFTNPMAKARRQHNATLLADGKVMVVGGTSGSGFNDQSNAVLFAELWDPSTGKWTQLPSQRKPRVYHSIALLMPDGRVLSGGGGEGGGGTNQFNVEMYSPPYLFKPDGSPASRPQITSAPAASAYGAAISISSPEAANISRVALVRLPAVTHAFDANQRYVPLEFAQAGDGALTVSMPADPNLAPPGHYMLFLLDGNGVPSVAQIVRLDL